MHLHSSWKPLFDSQLKQPYFQELREFLHQEQQLGEVYPPLDQIFRAFELTPAATARVILIGQDPYHQPKQAGGLCFSVPDDVPPPPSLRNIFSEMERDLQIPVPPTGNLVPWAEKGVLLLNTTLTVRRDKPLSHAKRGWETFTSAALKMLWQLPQPLVFLLWGQNAKQAVEPLTALPTTAPRLLLKAPHPSPLSAHRGFLGCGHFSKVDEFLQQNGESKMEWALS